MRHARGITRLEVAVVVGICVVLVGLLVPAIAVTKEESNMEVCASNLRAISVALGSYAYKNSDLMPESPPFGIQGWQFTPPNGKPWDLLLSWPEALVIDGDLVQATNRNGELDKLGSRHYPATGYGYFLCPSFEPLIWNGQRIGGRTTAGYAMAWCASSDFGFKLNGFAPRPSKRTVSVKSSQLVPEHIVAVDGFVGMAYTAAFTSPAHFGQGDLGVIERHLLDGVPGANYLFADGHVEWSDTYGQVPSPVFFGADSSRAMPPIWVHP